MIAISAKELRLHLKSIAQRLQDGESFELIYRSRPIGNLIPKRTGKKITSNWLEELKSLQKKLKINKSGKKFDAVKLIRSIRD